MSALAVSCSVLDLQQQHLGKLGARCRLSVRKCSAKGKKAEKLEAENVETEEELDRKNLKYLWNRGWAPWEEIHPPDNEFALRSLGKEGKDNPLLPPEAEELLNERPLKLPPEVHVEVDRSYLEEPQVYSLIPPRDWPPPGWKVDPKELEFIRETHTMYLNDVVTPEDLQNARPADDPSICLDRWNTFMKQYDEWVAANKERLDREALEVDPEYQPGRRRTGSRYIDTLFELPFIYPGQHYRGMVCHIDLYDGAFIYIGAVHDAWVSIEDNDWYWLRHVVKVGTIVTVEILAKRDPYRFRFPIEARFVEPNIDRHIFRRTSKYPPIISRPGDNNLYELARETGRPYLLELTPPYELEKDPRNFCHPYIFKVWQLYAAEEMHLDAEENGGVLENGPMMELTEEQWKAYRNQGVVGDLSDEDEDEDEDESDKKMNTGLVGVLEPTDDVPYRTYLVKVDGAEMDLEAARAERQERKKMQEDTKNESYELRLPRRERQMADLDYKHRRRCWEELQALMRDVTCRLEAQLPVKDPRYSDDPYPDNVYNPNKKIWQADYIGDPKKTKYAKFRRDTKRSRRLSSKRANARAAAAAAAASAAASPTPGPDSPDVTGK